MEQRLIISVHTKKYREIEHKRTHILKQKNNFGGDGGIQYWAKLEGGERLFFSFFLDFSAASVSISSASIEGQNGRFFGWWIQKH